MATLFRLLGIVIAGLTVGVMMGVMGYIAIYIVVTVIAWTFGVGSC